MELRYNIMVLLFTEKQGPKTSSIPVPEAACVPSEISTVQNLPEKDLPKDTTSEELPALVKEPLQTVPTKEIGLNTSSSNTAIGNTNICFILVIYSS